MEPGNGARQFKAADLSYMRELALGGALEMHSMELYREGDFGEIYRHREDHAFEVAIQRKMSKPHYHTGQLSYFVFMDEAELQLGGVVWGAKFTVKVTTILIEVGNVYPIPPYVIHAAGPRAGSVHPVRLLMWNPQSRERSTSVYTDDSVFPDNIEIA